MDENRGLAMREILFRGKRTDNGEWVQGDLLLDQDLEQAQIVWFEYKSTEDGVERYGDGAIVDPETVGQYTGLTDKNGRKVFEGDIVERGDRIWIIEYDVKYAKFVMKTFTERGVFWTRSFDLIPSEWCEVIGNIFDNPELLKGGNNNG